MLINEIAEVIPGYAFRGAVEESAHGGIYLFQAKNLLQGEPVSEVDTLTRIEGSSVERPMWLKKNDVLLVARGMGVGSFRSTVFISDADNVMASSSVHIIRITNSAVSPFFLSHYLNSRVGQNALLQIMSGSYIGALSRKGLEVIEIPIPPLDRQNLIVSLHDNLRRQQRILANKSSVVDNIINATFSNLATI